MRNGSFRICAYPCCASFRAASSRWRQSSAQLGMDASFSLNSAMAAGMSIFWGQTAAQAPQATQAEGRLSSGRASSCMGTVMLFANFRSLKA